jgi:opacity protein-like surface antigen
MKKYAMLFLIGLLLTSFSSVSAQGLKGKFAFRGIGGLALPVGDLADENHGAAKTGFSFGGEFEYYVSDFFALGGNFHYPIFGVKTDDLEEAVEYELYLETGEWYNVDIDGKEKVPSFGVFGKYLFAPYAQVSPYAKFGTGLGKFKIPLDLDIAGVGSVDFDASFDSKFYISVGSGIQYRISPNAAFTLEANYTHVFTDDAEGEIEIEAGPFRGEETTELDYNISYIGIYSGLTIFFGGTK